MTLTPSSSGEPSEGEKWAADIELRRREVAVKEAEQHSREQAFTLQQEDLALKRREAEASRWTSPLVVAIIAASLAAARNAVVTIINGNLERNIEASKAESSLILEVVKTGDPEKAAANLQFLLDAGLVTDPARTAAMSRYLQSRKPGSGVALPVADKNFTFEHTAGATPEATQAVANALTPYIKHLIAVGFPAELPKVSIKIDPQGTDPSYYLPDQKVIVLSSQGERDAMFPLAEYTIHALEIGRSDPAQGLSLERLAVEYGVRDYLVASYLDDPNLGARYKAIFGAEAPSLQLLTPRSYKSIGPSTEAHETGVVWAGAFWALREALGPEKIDPLVVAAWRAVPTDTPAARYQPALLAALKAQALRLGGSDAERIGQVLRARDFP